MAQEYLDLQLRQRLRVGLPAQTVQEVLRLQPEQICPISGVHPLLLGVSNWRGKLLWNLDLSDWLSLRPDTQTNPGFEPLTALVLTDAQGQRAIACIVQQLLGLVDVVEEAVQPLPAQFPEAVRRSFWGAVRGEQPMLLLDVDRLFQPHNWSPPGESVAGESVPDELAPGKSAP